MESPKVPVAVDPALAFKAYDEVRSRIAELEKQKSALRGQIETILRASPGKKLEAGGFAAEMKRIESEALDKEGVIEKFGRRALAKFLTMKRSWRVNVVAVET